MDLPEGILREVCGCLAIDMDVMEEFFEAVGLPRNTIKKSIYREIFGYTKHTTRGFRNDSIAKLVPDMLFGILTKHSTTPVQLLRNVCATLFDDGNVVDLIDNALLSYKPRRSLHLVRPLKEIRELHVKQIQSKPIAYIQRGRILIVETMCSSGSKALGSFFSDLDATSEVTILDSLAGDAFDFNFLRTLESWQQNQG